MHLSTSTGAISPQRAAAPAVARPRHVAQESGWLLENLVHEEERYADPPPGAQQGEIPARMPVSHAPAVGKSDMVSTTVVAGFKGPPLEVQGAPQRDEKREADTFDELRELGQQECDKLRPDARQRILQQGQADRQLMLERHGHFPSGAKRGRHIRTESRIAGGPAD